MRKGPAIRIGLALLALTLALPGADSPAAGESRFDDTATVTVVEVPVRVLLKGQPVRGLTVDNFVLFDHGRRRTPSSFEVLDVRLAAPEAALAEPPPPLAARRKFLLLFDLGFTRPADVARAEAAARELVRNQLAPSDLVAVACYGSRQGLEVLLNFTSDRQRTLQMLDGLGFLLGGDVEEPEYAEAVGRRDPLRLSTPSWQATLTEVGRVLAGEVSLAEEALAAAPTEDSLGAFLQRNILSNMASIGMRDRQAQEGALVVHFADSLGRLAAQTAGVPGEKHLVLFSNGFDEQLLETGRFYKYSAVGSGSWVLNGVNERLKELRRAGWAVHPVVPGASDAPAKSAGGLFHFAAETGGTLFENYNDLSSAVSRLDEETSLVYLLTFQPDDLEPDGSYRRLRVKLEGAPKGAKVRHKDGYYAPRTGAAQAAQAEWTTGAWLASGSEIDQMGVEVVAVPFGRAGSGTRVALLADIAGEGLIGPHSQGVDRAGAELFAYAFGQEGQVRDFLATRAGFDLSKHRSAVLAGGLQMVGDLTLAPGSYRLRFGVRNLVDDRLAVKTLDLEIPADARAARGGLYPPMFLADPDHAGVVVWRPGGEGEGAYPFMAGDLRLTPSARPSVRPPRPARVALMGWGLEGRSLTARLIAADRSELPATVTLVGKAPAAAGRPDLLLLGLETADLLPGGYWLELTISDPTGVARSSAARVAFRVL